MTLQDLLHQYTAACLTGFEPVLRKCGPQLPLSDFRGGSSDCGEEGSGKKDSVEEPGQEQKPEGMLGLGWSRGQGVRLLEVWGLKAGISNKGPWSLTPPPPQPPS